MSVHSVDDDLFSVYNHHLLFLFFFWVCMYAFVHAHLQTCVCCPRMMTAHLQTCVLSKDDDSLWPSFVALWDIIYALWFQSDLFGYALDMPVIVPATTSPVKSTQQLIQNSISPPSLSSMLDISLPAPSNRKSPFPLPQTAGSIISLPTASNRWVYSLPSHYLRWLVL